MKYGITRRIMGCDTFIDVSEAEFDEAKLAKSNLMQALFSEEKFNYVLENYCGFERELLHAAVDSMLFSELSWSKGVNEVHTINRRIVNLLTACRLYVDQVIHDTRLIYGENSNQSATLKRTISEQYDSHLGYRALETIRNYVQHRGFPAHLVQRDSRRVDTEASSLIKHTVIPKIDVSALAADGKFKRRILQELEAVGETIDIRPLIREYIESLGRIHLHIRESLKNDCPKWEDVLKRVATRFKEADGNNIVGLAVVVVDSDGQYIDRVEIFDEFVTRRHELERKNGHLKHCASHFVSSEASDA